MIVAPRAEGVESFALDRHRDRLSELIVFISDLNGPRGGAGKLCRVTAVLKGLPPLTILEQSQNVLSGLTRAGPRLALRIDRHSKSRRSLRLRPTRLRRRTTGGQP
jgi:hypothetical protein